MIAPMRLPQRLTVFSLACLLAMPPAPAADQLPELGDVASNELSQSTEKRIGQQIMNDIRWRDPSYLDDAEVEEYLNQLGGHLAAASSDPGIGFYFFPVNDSTINAFAMPGGFIGVNTGLLLAAQSESEVAGVLAHEISHVTQRHIARQISLEKQMSVASMVAMAVALLAARSNGQVASAAVVSAGGAATQAQLGFSRDFEREADRSGFDVLRKAGFDVRGMSSFFERMQRATRVYETNAPVYLRTHPVTVERISDMQNREHGVAYRQVPDSLEFQLVRAKLKAIQGRAPDAVKEAEATLKDKKYANEAAAHYGLAVALSRTKDWAGADRELQAARRLKAVSPMIERLGAEMKINQGDAVAGLAAYKDLAARYPLNHAILYGYGETLQAQHKDAEALAFAEAQLQNYPGDVRLHKLQAASYAALGRRSMQHRALAEVYALQGQTGAAVEQLQLAQKAGDANFYEQSTIDARLRELKQRMADEAKEKRN